MVSSGFYAPGSHVMTHLAPGDRVASGDLRIDCDRKQAYFSTIDNCPQTGCAGISDSGNGQQMVPSAGILILGRVFIPAPSGSLVHNYSGTPQGRPRGFGSIKGKRP
jgi:hypothetical protein